MPSTVYDCIIRHIYYVTTIMHGHLAIFVEMLWYYTATTTTYLYDVTLHHQYNDNGNAIIFNYVHIDICILADQRSICLLSGPCV